ncbi:MAG: nucleotidyltransferase domain-containing protein [Deltaproteobacteria bacterium]|jgi:predicted nucleotidyltransferase|nr:nucleotidyltransferase domain-containing protein [Deltaproteobacteria bacterium]
MNFDHGLTQRQLDCLRGILAPFAAEIERVAVFGSRASGKYRPDSDIDLALYGPVEEKTVDRLRTLFMDSPLPLKVDIQAYARINSTPLLHHIDAAGKTLFTHDDLLR